MYPNKIKRDLELLAQSIGVWRVKALIPNSVQQNYDKSHTLWLIDTYLSCPLCSMRRNTKSFLCPIYKFTGNEQCRNTPFYGARTSRNCRIQMLDFLIQIYQELKEKQNDIKTYKI